METNSGAGMKIQDDVAASSKTKREATKRDYQDTASWITR
jgi:hypothetical protein